MAVTRFSAGQLLYLLNDLRSAKDQPEGPYTVVRVMPGEAPELSYRIKHDSEAFERVVTESQLTESGRIHDGPAQTGFKPKARLSLRPK